MHRPDTICGLVFVCLAVFVASYSQFTFPSIPGTDYGPAFFPTLVALLMLLAGGALSIRGLRESRPDAGPDQRPKPRSGMVFVRLSTVLLIPLLYATSLRYVGFPLLAFLSTAIFMVVLGARALTAILISGTVINIVYFLFLEGLGVPLPSGRILEFLR